MALNVAVFAGFGYTARLNLPEADIGDRPQRVKFGSSGFSTPSGRYRAVEPAQIGHFETFVELFAVPQSGRSELGIT
jgi:hypothetical protein